MVKPFIRKLYFFTTYFLPFGSVVRETIGTQTPIKWRYIFWQKILGFNRHAYWPVHFTSMIGNQKNIICGIETCPGYMPGCYIQGSGKLIIGDYTQIAANVGIITQNHNPHANKDYLPPKPIEIGRYGWVGMNSVILPGVVLGDFTIVGAGSVVTKSFPEGYCVIAGNPAKLVRKLEPEKCQEFKSHHEYNGYIKADQFPSFRKKRLSV